MASKRVMKLYALAKKDELFRTVYNEHFPKDCVTFPLFGPSEIERAVVASIYCGYLVGTNDHQRLATLKCN